MKKNNTILKMKSLNAKSASEIGRVNEPLVDKKPLWQHQYRAQTTKQGILKGEVSLYC